MKKIVVLCILLLCVSLAGMCQTINPVFLKNDWIAVGIHPAGSFGASNAPNHYPSNVSLLTEEDSLIRRLGFLYDPNGSNFTSPTSTWWGDYFTPGAPVEGWGIDYRQNAITTNLVNFGLQEEVNSMGLVNLDANSLSVIGNDSAVWIGGTSTVQIIRSIRITNDAIKIWVRVKNISSQRLDTVRVMENVDPDNEQVITGHFVTQNWVRNCPTGSQAYARGLSAGVPLTLGYYGSQYPSRATVNYAGLFYESIEESYNQLTPSSDLPWVSDVGMNLIITLGALEPGEEKVVGYEYNFRTQTIVSVGPDQEVCQGSSFTCPTPSLPGGDWTGYLDTNIPGVYTLTYTIPSDEPGCRISDDVIITVRPKPTLNISAPVQICLGQSRLLQVTGSYPSETSLTWQRDGVDISGAVEFSYEANVSGSYTVTAHYNGCSSISDPVMVTAQTPVTASISGVMQICLEQSTTLTATGNGPGTFTYFWYRDGQYLGEGNTKIVVSSGNYRCDVTRTLDGNVCTGKSDTLTLVVNSLPSGVSITQENLCINAPIQILSGGTPTGGVYKVNGTVATSINPAELGVGTHSLSYTYTNSNGCSRTVAKGFNVYPTPIVTLDLVNEICLNADRLTLSGGSPSGGSYRINGQAATRFDPAVWGIGSHIVSYTYTNPQGCSASESDTIIVRPLPVFEFATDTIWVEVGKPYVLGFGQAMPVGLSYQWSNGSTDSTTIVTESGWYTVVISNEFGCSISDEIYIEFYTKDDCEKLKISVHPNPIAAGGILKLSRGNCLRTGYTSIGNATLEISNTNGTVLHSNIPYHQNLGATVPQLTPGVYVLKITAADQSFLTGKVCRIVIQ